jgi:hypothetical protein
VLWPSVYLTPDAEDILGNPTVCSGKNTQAILPSILTSYPFL